ncbi:MULTISPECIES: SIMPL domain-containing protein [Hydrogenophaga]|uniref:SIMPL domain-containing protein n=1 Tax=Hydrogenophaga electricum TaxID=1230953 RepID=A0ABQ6C406_9BURK|nr:MULTISPECIES: SIMPL domain-containing protein [Hydrogenophaga]GLS14617.1 SIMPL domain-containing protein [Hydrogenophaga electricum]
MANGASRLIVALIVGGGIAVAGFFVSGGLERFRMADRTIAVKGLAEKDVEADFAIWTLSFRRAGNEFAGVQQALAADREKVLAFLKAQGFKDDELEARPLAVQDLLARDYAQGNVPFRFNGSGQVLIRSARVTEVAQAALALDPLIQSGVQFSGDGEGAAGPRYQLRGFNDIKAPLLAEATRNAREQAEKFATEAGAKLGPLKSANQGVIRITGDDGNDFDDGSSRSKRLRVVSSFEYELR